MLLQSRVIARRLLCPRPSYLTRRQLTEILSVNPVVKKKLGEECDRILALGASCLKSGPADAKTREAIQAERAILKNKTIALGDLVTVFRALD